MLFSWHKKRAKVSNFCRKRNSAWTFYKFATKYCMFLVKIYILRVNVARWKYCCDYVLVGRCWMLCNLFSVRNLAVSQHVSSIVWFFIFFPILLHVFRYFLSSPPSWNRHSGAGTFFGQGGLKIVRSCQRSSSPPDPPFFERTFLRAGHSADLFW